MTDLELNDLRQFHDMAAHRQYRMLTEHRGMSPDLALQAVAATTRDRARSPMQWSSAPNGGFSPPDVQTWLPVNPNFASGVNVAAQADDPNSLLTFYRRMLQLRRATPALIVGDYHALHAHSDRYVAFVRHDATTDQTCLVVLNFSPEEQTIMFDWGSKQARLLFSSHVRDDQLLAPDRITVAPFEVFVAELA